MRDGISDAAVDAFAGSRGQFEQVVGFLSGAGAEAMTHGQLEDELRDRGRLLLLRLLQDHVDLRAVREDRVDVRAADGSAYGSIERAHERGLATIFGEVTVARLAYRRRGCANLYPADAALNIPLERHSHGLRRMAAVEASRGSFDDATATIRQVTATRIGKRQVEALACRAASDVESFYAAQPRTAVNDSDVLVLSADGKGIVMRPDALRPATAAKAAVAQPKLATRLSKGEKRNRKRMAEVGAVYDIAPAPRSAADVLASDPERERAPAPKAINKWLTASVTENAAQVIGRIFDEADRRDPEHRRPWIALVDGNNHQIERIEAEAAQRKITVPIVIDFIHVLEYIWKAAWCFYAEGDPAVEKWVTTRALAVLDGNAKAVAATIRRQATRSKLAATQRTGVDRCANYLTNKHDLLDYPTALRQGWPIATGIIEGACRHLVKDRMDITGARWGLEGAEAILKLRALRSNSDFDAYWRHHLAQEHQRTHQARYANNEIPTAA